jgi:hypothetical protein
VASDIQGNPVYIVFKAFAGFCYQYSFPALYYLLFIVDYLTLFVYHNPLSVARGFQSILYLDILAED